LNRKEHRFFDCVNLVPFTASGIIRLHPSFCPLDTILISSFLYKKKTNHG